MHGDDPREIVFDRLPLPNPFDHPPPFGFGQPSGIRTVSLSIAGSSDQCLYLNLIPVKMLPHLSAGYLLLRTVSATTRQAGLAWLDFPCEKRGGTGPCPFQPSFPDLSCRRHAAVSKELIAYLRSSSKLSARPPFLCVRLRWRLYIRSLAARK